MHQYTRGQGHPRAVKALADIYGRVMGREINPNSEVRLSSERLQINSFKVVFFNHLQVIVTVGAYSSLYFIIQAFVHPGDEVITLHISVLIYNQETCIHTFTVSLKLHIPIPVTMALT